MLPMLPPHELVRVLHQNADHPERLLSQENLGAESRRNLARAAQEIKAHPGQLIGLGLWGDGVPCNWDRSQSIECFTMSLPGIDGEWENMRMPIWATNKKFLVRHNTFDDVLTVVTWSLRCLAIGVMPSKRHDLSAWLPTDGLRSKQAKTPLPVKAVLCEVRGDWAFMKQCFRLPQSNEIKGCCWRCRVTPDGIRDASAGAPWRKQRLDHWDLIKRIHEDNANCSPLMGAPGLRSQCFAMDWLHVADLGITCNFLGGLFKLLLRKMEGRNESDRCSQLFLRMQQFYKENKTESRLDKKAPSSEPKALRLGGWSLSQPNLQTSCCETTTKKNGLQNLRLVPFTRVAKTCRQQCMMLREWRITPGPSLCYRWPWKHMPNSIIR